jgi:23S rRNA (uracil1939-C5)-methyltransferase
VFVPLTAPGDRIRARVTAQKSRLLEAELVEILEPSQARRKPPCPLTDRCGGCSWQHVEYSMQIEQKQQILKMSLRGLEKYGAIPWREFIPAPEEFNYRNRIQVQIRGKEYGFFAKRSHNLVPVRECLIAEKEINSQLKTLRPDYDGKIEIARTRDGKVNILGGERDPEAALFSQVNEAQNRALIQEMLEIVSIEPEWIMDLYAGSGNLTWPLAEKFPGIGMHAVEFSRASVEKARAERAVSGLKWHSGDVAKVLERLKPVAGRGLIVLDPPRLGASPEAIREILKHKPQQIVYVSCNPTTFARDAELLMREGAYRLESVRGLDMFPQTEHVELIASLCAAT